MNVVDLILKLAEAISGFGGHISHIRRDRRERVAVLLICIADCIVDITAQFRSPARYVPYNRCVELRTYFRNLQEITQLDARSPWGRGQLLLRPLPAVRRQCADVSFFGLQPPGRRVRRRGKDRRRLRRAR
jgi:hypothetical protein